MRSFTNTAKIGTQFVQLSTKGVEGAEWENLYYKLAVMNKEVNCRNLSGCSKAKTLWKIRDAKKEVDLRCWFAPICEL